MKSIYFYACLAGIVFVSIFYMHYKRQNVNTLQKLTSIIVSKDLNDVGIHSLRDSIFSDYIIINTGNNNLVLNDVIPDCHCISAVYSKKPIKPKDSTVIRLKYKPSYIGYFQNTAQIVANTNENLILLIIRGDVKSL